MSFLKFANEEEVTRYYYEENGVQTEDFIELRKEIAKKSATRLLKFAPKKEDDLEGGLRFIENAFAILAVKWSLTDSKPEVSEYQELTATAGAWIDRTISNHLRSVLNGDAEEAEGKLVELED